MGRWDQKSSVTVDEVLRWDRARQVKGWGGSGQVISEAALGQDQPGVLGIRFEFLP